MRCICLYIVRMDKNLNCQLCKKHMATLRDAKVLDVLPALKDGDSYI